MRSVLEAEGDSPRPRQAVRRLAARPEPVAALSALLEHGACLLESRTSHPGARWSFVPFNPTQEFVAYATRAELRKGGAVEHIADPWPALCRLLDENRGSMSGPAPFIGGWVGVLSHEAASWILGTPTPGPAPPARPDLPWATFRFFPDALAIDHAAGGAWLVGHDFGHSLESAEERLAKAERALARPAPTAAAARAQGPPRATLDDELFAAGVDRLKTLIDDGDCFQVNLTTSFAYAWTAQPTDRALVALYDAYTSANPGPWNAFFRGVGYSILSASPELLASVHGDTLALRPIAGTRGRSSDPSEDERLADELRSDPKEQAEHAMLVDLARNDAATLCIPGTVTVPNLGGIERYRHVMHLVSHVEGRVVPDSTIRGLLEAVFPGGTVTGAPKRRAVTRIAQTETGPRGPYTGSLGYVSLSGDTEWNLLIRTLVATPTHVVAHAGCGVVTGSKAPAELAELEAKARAQIDAALGAADPAPRDLRCGLVSPGPAWRPKTPDRMPPRRRVLLVDFEDSFVHNLGDYLRCLGAETHVASIHSAADEAWGRAAPTHVVLSPGPGRPDHYPELVKHLRRAEAAGVPVLGVCLGHQALMAAGGAPIVRHSEIVHGRGSLVLRVAGAADDPLFGPWKSKVAARYHSLVAEPPSGSVIPLARLEDGTLMAARDPVRPWWGVQFHPESLLTQDGMPLLAAFLEVPPRA